MMATYSLKPRNDHHIHVWILVLAAFFLSWAPTSQAAPVDGREFRLRQPNGTRVAVRIWGDEFYQVVESMDGYTLLRDPATMEICYARLSADGRRLESTGISANGSLPGNIALSKHLRESQEVSRGKVDANRARFQAQEQAVSAKLGARPQQAPPCNGNVKGITLIVQFPDEAGTIPSTTIDNFCNQTGYTGYGNNGSIRDYFYDVSDGHLTYTNYVSPTYYTALHNKSYYDNPAEDIGQKARELVLEALNWLNASGFDFSQYDANGDGIIDAINCLYAGSCGSGWSKGLWPHSGGISFSADGVVSSRYEITDLGDNLTIRTFCHENGHMICYWPDLYDYGSESNGLGNYCLMAYGGSNKNPVEPCPYMKYISNWATVTDLVTAGTGLSLPAKGNIFYKYPNPTLSKEYYLISNIQKTGRNAYMPDEGLAIWHIDTGGSNNNEEMTSSSHYLVTLVQADGRWDLEHKANYGNSGDLYHAVSVNRCDRSTNPGTPWWNGYASGLCIRNISGAGSNVTFDFDQDQNAVSAENWILYP